jgi:hypothetical protein
MYLEELEVEVVLKNVRVALEIFCTVLIDAGGVSIKREK